MERPQPLSPEEDPALFVCDCSECDKDTPCEKGHSKLNQSSKFSFNSYKPDRHALKYKPETANTFYVLSFIQAMCDVHIFYAVQNQTNYIEELCFRLVDDYVRFDFLNKLIDRIKNMIETKNYVQATNNTKIREHALTQTATGVFVFSNISVRLGLRDSLANNIINGKFPDIITTYVDKFVVTMYRKYQVRVIYYSESRVFSYSMLDLICRALQEQPDWAIEIIDVFGKILYEHISLHIFGTAVGVHETTDAIGSKLITKWKIPPKNGFVITDDFFLIAFSYYKYYWDAPAFAETHHLHPLKNIFLSDYYCFDTNRVALSRNLNSKSMKLELFISQSLVNLETLEWQCEEGVVIAFVSHLEKWDWNEIDTGYVRSNLSLI